MSEVKQMPRIQDLNKFTLFADIPGVTKQRARLSWSMRGTNPRITAFAFNPNTNKNEVTTAPLSPDIFLIFCDQFLAMIDSNQTNIKAKIETLTSVRDAGNKPTQEKKLLSELWYGIDANGIVWMSIVEGDKPRIKFTFNIWGYNVIYKTDGTALTEAEASRIAAKSSVSALKAIYIQNMAEFTEYVPQSDRTIDARTTDTSVAKIDPSVLEDINF